MSRLPGVESNKVDDVKANLKVTGRDPAENKIGVKKSPQDFGTSPSSIFFLSPALNYDATMWFK